MGKFFKFSIVFLLLAGSAGATQSEDPAGPDQQALIEQATDFAMAKLFRPGPVQHGWDKGGVDIYKLLDAAPGGAARNFLLVIDKDGERSVQIIRANHPGSLVPKEWKAVVRLGAPWAPADSGVLDISGADGPFYLAGWESHRRVGDAFCSRRDMGGELYEAQDEAAESEIPRELMPVFLEASFKRVKQQPLCWRYDRDGDGFKLSYFLPDGRTLPGMNDFNEHVAIVRAAPVADLLKGQ